MPSDKDDFEPEHALPQEDQIKAAQYYNSAVIPQQELTDRNRKRKLEQEEEARAASRRPPSPAVLAALRQHYVFPSLADTIAGFHPHFRQAFHVSAGLSRGGERSDERTHSPPLTATASRQLALQQAGGELRADHPHPHLSSLADSSFTLKREEIDVDVRPEPITAEPLARMKAVAAAAAEERLSAAARAEPATALPIPSLPPPATIASVAPPLVHQLSNSSTVPDTYAAPSYPPAFTSISSNATYSTSYGSAHMPYPPPPDPSAVPSYYPMASAAAYSSPGLHPHNYNRQHSLESGPSAAPFPYPYAALEAQHPHDGSSNPAAQFYRHTSMELQAPDDSSGARHANMPPSLSNAPHLQMSHSTPLTAAMYLPLPSPDTHHSYAAQPQHPYFNAPVPQLPHTQSAPQPNAMMPPYLYHQPPNQHPAAPYAMPLRPQPHSEINASHAHFSDNFHEQKRRHSSNGSGGNNNHNNHTAR